MSEGIIIRRSGIMDGQGIYNLHKKWRDNHYNKFNDLVSLDRFLSPYTFEQIFTISESGYAAIATKESDVISYYFINPFFETGNVAKRKVIIENKIEEGILPKGKYAFSLQSATDEIYTGKGLNREALNYLRGLFKNEYDYFIGVMDYDNTATHKSSLKMGWKHFGDIGIGLLAVIGTTDERNDLLNP